MRALVMEIKKNKMIVMRNDGTFLETGAVSGAQIGEEVVITERPAIWNKINRYAGIAAAIALVLLGGIQVNAYYTPYGYVNVDINPSIQVGFNKFERVISIKGLNKDGEKVITHSGKVKNAKIEDAVKALVETAGNDNYLKEGTENEVMVSTYSPKAENSNQVKDKVNNSVLLYLNSQSKKAEIINELVSKEEIDRAALQNISVGKLKLYEKAKQAGVTITLDEVKFKPVKEIRKLINESKKEEKQTGNKPVQSSGASEKLNKADTPEQPAAPEVKEKADKPKVNKPEKGKKDKENGKKSEDNKGKSIENSLSNEEVINNKGKIPRIPNIGEKKVNERIKEIEKRKKEIIEMN